MEFNHSLEWFFYVMPSADKLKLNEYDIKHNQPEPLYLPDGRTANRTLEEVRIEELDM